MRGWRASGVREDGSSAFKLGLPTSSTMGAGDCASGGAKGMVPRVIPRLRKTEVCRELRKWPLPVRLGMLDGSFEVAGTGAYAQCEENV